jgi:uncharacterized membrane protein
MKEETLWKLLAGIILVTLSLVLLTAHFLIFQDSHHLFFFLAGDLAFMPIEVLVVTLIIDQMLESREKQQRMEKLNLVIGAFFSKFGIPLLGMVFEHNSFTGMILSLIHLTEELRSRERV